MSNSRTHPHIDQPTEDDLLRLIEGKPPLIRELYMDVHRLVLETVPDIKFAVDCKDCEIGYGARQYGYDGWGMATLTPYSKWVSVTFLKGTALPDREGLLEGKSATMRHVKIRSREELATRRSWIARFLQAAASLNR